MNQYCNFLNKIWRIFLAMLFVLFMLLSANNLLPLKWQFPFWKLSPHLTIIKEGATAGTRSDYVNSFGEVTVALDKNYASIVKTLDQNDNCILEQYFDSHGKPAVLSSGCSAIQREFDEDGKWICTNHLDSELKPITIRAGYNSVRRTYNKAGQVETETYYGTDGLPAPDIYDKYGTRYNYNEDGHRSVVTYLDADGKAMNNKDHFAVIRRTYTPDGKLHMEMLYDKDGNPAILSYGQSGYLYEDGRTICLDRDGNRMFSLRFFLRNSIPVVLLIGIFLLLLIILSDRPLTWVLLLLYLIFIAYMTVIDRESGSSAIRWALPPNYYLFFADREVLSNIWLFVPLGAILYKLSHMWEIIGLPITLTLMIETTQLIFDIGAFELSDLIANSLGGLAGVTIIYLLSAPLPVTQETAP